ncbi:MAG: MFS transporter [Pseudomonadota bacterium]|nr:MFS transporter [Pseudomonadota bacterium]
MNKNEIANISWPIQAAIYGSGFFSFSMVLISSLVVTVMAYELTHSEFLIGMIVGSRYFLTLVLSIHGGVLMDRFGTRRVMIFVAAMATVAPVFFPLALALPTGPAITAIILLQMINGVSDTMVWMGTQALSGQIMKGRQLYIGRMTSIVRLGAFLGPILFGFVWDQLGIWTTFIAMAIWSGMGFYSVLKIPSTPLNPKTIDKLNTNLSDLIPRFKDYISAFRLIAVPAVALVLIVTFVRIGGTGIQGSFYVVFLKDINFPVTLIGILLGVAQLIASGGSLLAQPFSKIIHVHWLLLLAVSMTVVTVALTPLLAFGHGLWPIFTMLVIVISIRGLFLGMCQATEISVLGQNIGDDQQGVGVGLRTTVNRIASSFIPPLMGGVAELIGVKNSFFVMGVFLLMFVAMASYFVRYHHSLGKSG